MILALLIAQASLVMRPMFLADEPPPVRSVRHILLTQAEVPGAKSARTKADALALAVSIVARVRAGDDFERAASEYSDAPDVAAGIDQKGFLGTFPPGVLAPEFDAFLFHAAEFEVSDPIDTANGIHILQRVDTHAAVLRILVEGEGAAVQARCDEISRKLASGVEFAELARTSSDDKISGARGGQFGIYERTWSDKLLKAAAFRARVGQVIGPIEVKPFGFNFLKRVPLEAVDPKLADRNWIRVRGLLVQFDDAKGARDRANKPSQVRAKEIADEYRAKIVGGADMRSLARQFDDDVGGREREGDLGWIHRGLPNLAPPLRDAFQLPVGGTSEVYATTFGFLIVKRER